MATPIFSNEPLFNQKPISVEGILNMQQFDVIAQTDPENNSVAQWLGTDSLESALWVKNVVRQLVHVGGEKIDLNFLFDMYYSPDNLITVDSKRLVNHYIQDPDLNIYAAATRVGTGSVTFQLLKQNHLQGGTYSYPANGLVLFDKDAMRYYIITNVDTSVPYAHKVTIESAFSPTEVITIQENTAYTVIPANFVGGYSCPNIINDAMSLGYVQQVNFIRVRKDWEVTMDVLRSFRDKFQFAPIYDREGIGYDAWDLYEMKMMREDIRMMLNVYSWIGTPIQNSNLTSGVNAIVDQDHVGYYGVIPSIQFGGGILSDFSASVGWDWESDGEPILLYQDSLKRTRKFMVWKGTQLSLNMDYRANKMVARQNVGATIFEAYKRVGTSPITGIEKLGMDSYNYRGFDIDMKIMSSLSDKRFIGSAQWSNSMTWIPATGCTEQGKEIAPIEFFQYGQNGWTGDYEEHLIDNRIVTGCDSLQGWGAQSLAMKMHCPQLFVFAQGVADA